MYLNGDVRFPVKVGPSNIHGRGLFAVSGVPARKKLGALAGQIISRKEGRARAKKQKTISIVELWNGKSLDATQSNELRYINHSCQPNTFMRTIGFHVEFYTLKEVKPGEEFTCDYGETHHEGSMKCNCGVPGCKGLL